MLYFPEVWKLEKFQITEMTFKVTQGHWCWCHTRSLTSVALCLYTLQIKGLNIWHYTLRSSVSEKCLC